MPKLHFPEPFKHSHPPVQNLNEIIEAQLTFGQRASDWVTQNIGSWTFIIVQSMILTVWVLLNITAYLRHWDPYPFILMNLVLSLQAAYTAPIIMMSQNRQSIRDRLDAHNDYEVNQKAEQEVRAILDHLAAQNTAITEIHRLLENLRTEKN
ncbi:MAG TPA: DUF1003 domain-containing protein [Syntrophales bacterium]|nr:DUF1003 domain-containing protein [Syntrophales bacterium]